MKICDYCGKSNEDAMGYCAGCGTVLDVPKKARTTSVSALIRTQRTLNASAATFILFAYLLAQLVCGLGIGMTSVAIAAARGIHSERKIYAISEALGPVALLLTFALAGLVVVFLSFKLVPKQIKDTSPNGAAWVLGGWRPVLAALVIGLIVRASAHLLLQLISHATSSDSGYVTRMSLTRGLPQNLVIIVGLLFAPLVEEILFRGVLYGGFRKSFGSLMAAILTTLSFTMFHITEYNHFPLGIIVVVMEALVALWCRLRWGAIGPAIGVHVGFNSISALIVVCRTWR